MFGVWACYHLICCQNLCFLVLGVSVACFVCACSDESSLGTKPQESFPEKSFHKGRAEEGEAALTGASQMRSILCIFSISDMLPRKFLLSTLGIWEADTGQIWRKIKRGRRKRGVCFFQCVSLQISIQCLLLTFLRDVAFHSIFHSLEVLRKWESPNLFS